MMGFFADLLSLTTLRSTGSDADVMLSLKQPLSNSYSQSLGIKLYTVVGVILVHSNYALSLFVLCILTS